MQKRLPTDFVLASPRQQCGCYWSGRVNGSHPMRIVIVQNIRADSVNKSAGRGISPLCRPIRFNAPESPSDCMEPMQRSTATSRDPPNAQPTQLIHERWTSARTSCGTSSYRAATIQPASTCVGEAFVKVMNRTCSICDYASCFDNRPPTVKFFFYEGDSLLGSSAHGFSPLRCKTFTCISSCQDFVDL